MKIFRKANTVGALMIAAGAVVTGASVTSGAMAADDAGRPDSGSAVVVGSASPGGESDAYQCVFEGVELPQLEAVGPLASDSSASGAVPIEVPATGTGELVATGVAGVGGTTDVEGTESGRTPEGDATSFQVTIDENGDTVQGPVSGPAGGEVPIEVSGLGIDGSGNVVMSTGELSSGESLPADAIEITDVREGTEEECAALMGDLQESTTPSLDAAAGTDTVTKTAP